MHNGDSGLVRVAAVDVEVIDNAELHQAVEVGMVGEAQVGVALTPEEDLLRAAVEGDLTEVQNWIEQYPEGALAEDNVLSSLGKALRLSAFHGHVEIVSYLVEIEGVGGIIINSVDNNGGTALHCAASEGEISVVEYLVRQDANLTLTTSQGVTVLDAAVSSTDPRSLSTVRYLLSQAVISEQLINSEDGEGERPIHRAALTGDLDIVESLVLAGADRDATNRQGETALFHIINSGRRMGANDLLALGFNTSLTDNDGNTLLHTAARVGSRKWSELLVKTHNIYKQNNEGQDSIDLAPEWFQEALYKASANARAQEGGMLGVGAGLFLGFGVSAFNLGLSITTAAQFLLACISSAKFPEEISTEKKVTIALTVAATAIISGMAGAEIGKGVEKWRRYLKESRRQNTQQQETEEPHR